MKKLLVVPALLAKAHYDSFTKKDGTFVQAHDDKRAAAKPKMVLPKKAPAAADPYGHPNVVGKPSKMVNYQWSKETGTKETPHEGKPTDAQEIHFLGKKYLRSSRDGTSMHDQTPVRRYDEDDGTDEGGHRVWLDDSGRVHADSTSEVKGLRSQYEAHAKKPAGGAMGPDEVKQHAVAAGAKFRSNVSVFSKPELAHSFAEQTKGAKGSAFVMKHPDHQHHVVVGGADAQRMEKNGYQHVRPGA